MKKTLFVLALIFVGCGIKVKGIPSKVEGEAKVGPDFEGAAKFCDERYGYMTEEAEQCFEDYRTYTKIVVRFDMESVQAFCEKSYTDPVQQAQCISSIADFITKQSPSVGGSSGSGT